MKAGDILLCSGNSWMSRKIKFGNRLVGVKGEAAEITHVATAYGVFEVFESTTMNKWADKRGVQSNASEAWLENYNGKVWRRRLSIDMDFIAQIVFVRDHVGDEYESGIAGLIELIACIFQANVRQNLDKVHCSEIVTALYQELGLLPRHLLANNFPPHTFWTGGEWETNLRRDVYLGEPVRLK